MKVPGGSGREVRYENIKRQKVKNGGKSSTNKRTKMRKLNCKRKKVATKRRSKGCTADHKKNRTMKK